MLRSAIRRHNKAFTQACELAEDASRDHRALALFARALQIHPANWCAVYMQGKIYQRAGEHGRALDRFGHAHTLAPRWSIAAEATIEAIHVGDAKAAVHFANAAIVAAPRDPALYVNLALALLVGGDVKAAACAIADAVRRAPRDVRARRVRSIVMDVARGKRPIPRRRSDLD